MNLVNVPLVSSSLLSRSLILLSVIRTDESAVVHGVSGHAPVEERREEEECGRTGWSGFGNDGDDPVELQGSQRRLYGGWISYVPWQVIQGRGWRARSCFARPSTREP